MHTDTLARAHTRMHTCVHTRSRAWGLRLMCGFHGSWRLMFLVLSAGRTPAQVTGSLEAGVHSTHCGDSGQTCPPTYAGLCSWSLAPGSFPVGRNQPGRHSSSLPSHGLYPFPSGIQLPAHLLPVAETQRQSPLWVRARMSPDSTFLAYGSYSGSEDPGHGRVKKALPRC